MREKGRSGQRLQVWASRPKRDLNVRFDIEQTGETTSTWPGSSATLSETKTQQVSSSNKSDGLPRGDRAG